MDSRNIRRPPSEICIQCQKPLTQKQRNRQKLFCSNVCRSQEAHTRYREYNPNPTVATGTRGAISELLVGADLLNRGYEVFRALSSAAECDLIVIADGKALRVEVRTASRTISGKLTYPNTFDHPHDILALCCRDGEITYEGLPMIAKPAEGYGLVRGSGSFAGTARVAVSAARARVNAQVVGEVTGEPEKPE